MGRTVGLTFKKDLKTSENSKNDKVKNNKTSENSKKQ